MKITKAQKDALEVIRDMIDRSNTNVPDYGTKILALIFGILDVEVEDEKSGLITLNPNNGNDQIQIDLPDWIKDKPTPPFIPGDYQPPQVWYNLEPEPIQTDAREGVGYVAEVTCTGDKNGILHTSTTADVRYNGECVEYEEPKK